MPSLTQFNPIRITVSAFERYRHAVLLSLDGNFPVLFVPFDAAVELIHRTRDGTGDVVIDRITVIRRPRRGGLRFICPMTSHTVRLLVLPRGARHFASCLGFGISRYVVDRTPFETAQARATKERQVFECSGYWYETPQPAWWMGKDTYLRRLARWQKHRDRANALWLAEQEKRQITRT